VSARRVADVLAVAAAVSLIVGYVTATVLAVAAWSASPAPRWVSIVVWPMLAAVALGWVLALGMGVARLVAWVGGRR